MFTASPVAFDGTRLRHLVVIIKSDGCLGRRIDTKWMVYLGNIDNATSMLPALLFIFLMTFIVLLIRCLDY